MDSVEDLKRKVVRLQKELEHVKGNYEALLDEAEGEIFDLRKRLGIPNIVPKGAKAGG